MANNEDQTLAGGGYFITLEGIEGVGKSTQVEFVADWFRRAGVGVTVTREPGGTSLGEAIREMLLDRQRPPMASETELLLMFAARAEHLDKVIKPGLVAGGVVISDRFTDATYAYQGGGRRVAIERIETLEGLVQTGLKPDLTLLLDVPVATALSRTRARGDSDRFEVEDQAFFEAVRSAYLELAKREPTRINVIDARGSISQVQTAIGKVLETWALSVSLDT